MKLGNYLKDKLISIIAFLFMSFSILILLGIFAVNYTLIGMIALLLFIGGSVFLFGDFFRKKKFYDTLLDNSEKLDRAYLSVEMMPEPSFYEAEIITEILSGFAKDMADHVQKYEIESISFREYIEMWVHEIKLPLSALTLSLHNYKQKVQMGEAEEEDTEHFFSKQEKELFRTNEYINQVLYYTRSENAEKDYHITKLQLKNVIRELVMENRNVLQDAQIEISVRDITEKDVLSDSKWLSFILGQLISNSVKYAREDVQSRISISTGEKDGRVSIYVEDNGIGIPEGDLERVFEKSFTGTNGMGHAKSTGMGLYIVKELCEKLGHEISIESKVNEYTKVTVTL